MKYQTQSFFFFFLLIFFMENAGATTYRVPRKFTLSNQLEVALLEDKSLPYISFKLLIPVGSSADPSGLEGLSYTVSQMLDQGTSRYTKKELSQKLENLGATFESYTTKDFSLFSASTLSWHTDALLELFTEIISRPELSEKELKWTKNQILSKIAKLPESANAFADRILSQMVFQNRPYLHGSLGYKKSIQAIALSNIKDHYRTHFVPNHAKLGVVGRYPSNIKKKLEEYFSKWEKVKNLLDKKQIAKKEKPQNPSTDQSKNPSKDKSSLDHFLNTPSFLVIHRKGQVQSEIRLGATSISRSSKDYLPLKIASTVLGEGGLDTRLFTEIREKHGLTYRVGSRLSLYKTEGMFSIQSPVRLPVTREATDRILDVLEKFYQKGITKEELEKAKKNYKIRVLQSNETAEQQLSRYMILQFYGISYDLPMLSRKLLRLKLPRVQKVIKKYMHPGHVSFIIFSDYEQIKSQLEDMKSLTVKDFNQFL